MPEIMSINHEGGDLSEWTSIVGDSGDITVSTLAGLARTNHGMRVRIDSTSEIQGIKEVTHSSNLFTVRFYLNPNGDGPDPLIIGTDDTFNPLSVDTDRPSFGATAHVRCLLGYDGSDFFLRPGLRDDAQSWNEVVSDITITDAEHIIELGVTRSTGVSADDAIMTVTVDGVLEETVSSVDLFTDWPVLQVRLGATGGIDSGTSGTFYIDEIKANDDGGEIGPVTFGDGMRPRYDTRDYNVGDRARYGSYGGRYS